MSKKQIWGWSLWDEIKWTQFMLREALTNVQRLEDTLAKLQARDAQFQNYLKTGK